MSDLAVFAELREQKQQTSYKDGLGTSVARQCSSFNCSSTVAVRATRSSTSYEQFKFSVCPFVTLRNDDFGGIGDFAR